MYRRYGAKSRRRIAKRCDAASTSLGLRKPRRSVRTTAFAGFGARLRHVRLTIAGLGSPAPHIEWLIRALVLLRAPVLAASLLPPAPVRTPGVRTPGPVLT